MFDRLARDEEDDDAPRRWLLSLTFTLWSASAGLCAFGSVVLGGPLPPVPGYDPPMFVGIDADPDGNDPLPALPLPVYRSGAPVAPVPAPPEPLDAPELPAIEPLSEVASIPPEEGWSCICLGLPTLPPPPPRIVRSLPLAVRRRVMPEYPRAAASLGLGERDCTADVSIDREGNPTDVVVSGCPRAFHGETRTALLKWRWYPPRAGRERVPTETRVSIHYRPR